MKLSKRTIRIFNHKNVIIYAKNIWKHYKTYGSIINIGNYFEAYLYIPKHIQVIFNYKTNLVTQLRLNSYQNIINISIIYKINSY